MSMPCTIEGCEGIAAQRGLCWAHDGRMKRGLDMNAPLVRLAKTKLEKLTEAAISYANAEDDEEFVKAREVLRKTAATYGPSYISEKICEALSAARARGVKLGAPRKIEPEVAVRMVAQEGSAAKAAKALRVSRRTVVYALRAAKSR